MAKGYEVLGMLCPDVEWSITGDDFENIIWHDGEATITKKQFADGFAQYDALKIQQDATKAQAKAALLERLGLTQEEFNTLTA
jgi:hypothetical protein